MEEVVEVELVALRESRRFSAGMFPTFGFRPMNAGGVVAARQPLPTTSGCTRSPRTLSFGVPASTGRAIYRLKAGLRARGEAAYFINACAASTIFAAVRPW
jgi:hypothetical protein